MSSLYKKIVSLVFDELLQLLDLAAELLSRCAALCRLHEKCCHLVAAQQACNTPLESVQYAGLHYSWTHKHTERRSIFILDMFISLTARFCWMSWPFLPPGLKPLVKCAEIFTPKGKKRPQTSKQDGWQVTGRHRWHNRNNRACTDFCC